MPVSEYCHSDFIFIIDYMYQDLIGEPTQITDHPKSIQSYEVFSKGFVFVAPKDASKSRIGDFTHIESEEPNSGLFYVSIERALRNAERSVSNFDEEKVEDIPSYFEISKILDESYEIDSFVVSENVIYLNCQSRTDLIYSDDTTCYRIELDPESILDEVEKSGEEALSSIKAVKLEQILTNTIC